MSGRSLLSYLNEFTPDWPHGHVVVFGSIVLPFVVKVTDATGDYPIWGYVVDGTTNLGAFVRMVATALVAHTSATPRRRGLYNTHHLV